MQLRVDGATTAWPSYVDPEAAVGALLAGQARSVELHTSRYLALVERHLPWASTLPQPVRKEGGWVRWLILWIVATQLFPLIDVLFHTKRR